jgi:hypothetical protein
MLILQSYSQETCYVAITKMQKYQKFQSPITMYFRKTINKTICADSQNDIIHNKFDLQLGSHE